MINLCIGIDTNNSDYSCHSQKILIPRRSTVLISTLVRLRIEESRNHNRKVPFRVVRVIPQISCLRHDGVPPWCDSAYSRCAEGAYS